MSVALIGRKAGMTRIFTDAGETVPVTVIEVLPNRITQVKSVDKDGYRAIQVSFGKKRPQLLSKAAAGHYAKANVEPGRSMVEFRLTEKEGTDLAVGSELKAGLFEAGAIVDVTGTTIGKGFAGTMKRHNFKGQGASHGNHKHHRAPGSIGQCSFPGRVFKGLKMSGQMGHEQVTTLNLEVVESDAERNVLLVRGSVPGPNGGVISVRNAVKSASSKGA
jgi:large subunit ribosomal protein L3